MKIGITSSDPIPHCIGERHTFFVLLEVHFTARTIHVCKHAFLCRTYLIICFERASASLRSKSWRPNRGVGKAAEENTVSLISLSPAIFPDGAPPF